jgi:putative oxidoreductase
VDPSKGGCPSRAFGAGERVLNAVALPQDLLCKGSSRHFRAVRPEPASYSYALQRPFPLIHAGLLTASSPAPVIVELVTAGAGILLLVGLWTPFAGGMIAVAELGLALSHPEDPWTFVQFGVLGAALALLGPGGCSVDARLFGRKQIQIPQR